MKVGNVLGLFDGISCGQIALQRAGIEYENYYASEIDEPAIKIAMKNYPETIQVGDVCSLTSKDLPTIDLMIGGSPCQGFSMLGKKLNFDDDRSKLFFEFVRLLKELKPKYWLLENVKMSKTVQAEINKLLGVEPIEINSALVSGQNRRRLYWTNIPDIEQPTAKHITGQSLLEDSSYLTATVRKGKDGGPRQIVKPATEKLGCITASYYKGVNADGRPAKVSDMDMYGDYSPDRIHMLSPIEAERLQTLPDDYTEGVSKTQRYKMIGNGWTVDVIAHIFRNMR
jgi:site-specific DNA-cytosine methylase